MRSHSTAQKQPSQPLWSENWHQQLTSVTCQVPLVYEHTTSGTTSAHKYIIRILRPFRQLVLGEVPSPTRPSCFSCSLSSVLEHPRDERGRNVMLHTIDLQLYIDKLEHVASSVSRPHTLLYRQLYALLVTDFMMIVIFTPCQQEGRNFPGVPTNFWTDPPNWRWQRPDACNPTW